MSCIVHFGIPGVKADVPACFTLDSSESSRITVFGTLSCILFFSLSMAWGNDD